MQGDPTRWGGGWVGVGSWLHHHPGCRCAIHLPPHSFARHNTRRGIETCGILAGTLSANDSIFTISTLIVPKQEGTTDTVQALGEEEIFDVQDSRGLYPLGWIHTHPTQSCFLSSIDVHTHCGYQVRRILPTHTCS